ncbi:hypothetical protein CXB51_019068 [Gossypium anomalum]|uniref:Syntaxin 6/10/61 N-terminal domain-containing protein n=1 Tax=Gossypium anomalum TaxID=47600 RepID=A0A8J5YVB8_9ROSI|nr:hypothetical protein CXB51_019068 [Gossypium anomalum]
MSMIINPLHSVFGISHHFRELNAPPLFLDPSELWKTNDLHHLVFLSLAAEMSKAQGPFYIVKEEIQESIDKLQSSFHQWERILPDTGEQVHLTKELLANCESIEWQMGGKRLCCDVVSYFIFVVNKTIDVAARDPSWYVIDNRELESRRRWTITARTQVGDVKKSVVARKENGNSASAMRHELMKLPISHQSDRSYQYSAEDNDDFIASESDRQMLLINRMRSWMNLVQVLRELEVLALQYMKNFLHSVGSISTISYANTLVFLEKIIDDLGTEMDSTTNRLDFVQKKVAMVMKKASANGQIRL